MSAAKKQRKAPAPAARQGDAPWLPRAELALAILLTAVALFLHLTLLTNVGGLWRDEVHTVQMASFPSVSNTIEAVRYDSFPLLSTLVLRGWIGVGLGGDQGLRIFGFLVGAVLLGSLWVACRFLGSATPLISLALVGVNSWVIRTADSIRPYGLGIVFIVLTLAFVWKAVETSRRTWYILAALAAVASVQCLYQNAFLVLAICLAGFVVCLRDSRVKAAVGVVLIGLAAALSLVPYLPALAAGQSWGALVRHPISMGRLFEMFFTAMGAGGPVTLWPWFAFGALCLGLGIHAVVSRKRQPAARARSNLALYCAIVLVAAVALYLSVMKATQLLTQPWYFVPLVVLIAPILDAAVRVVATTGQWRIVRLVVVIAIGFAMAMPAWGQLRERWTNIDVVAARVGERAKEGDIIVFNPFWLGITFQRYYKGPATLVPIPPLEDVHIVRFDLVKEAMARPGPLTPVLETLAKTLQGGHRVFWVQGMLSEKSAPPNLPPAPLPDTGWYLAPYLVGWGRQAEGYLEAHGLEADYLDPSTGGAVLPYEHVSVTVVSGWR